MNSSKRKKSFYKPEHGFKTACREGEDPLETFNVPLRKRIQKKSSNLGQKRGSRQGGIQSNMSEPCLNKELEYEDKVAGEILPVEAYIHVLKSGSLVVVDDCMSTFVLPEFDQKKCILKEDKYLIIQREAKSFNGSLHWTYACSCDSDRRDLLESLSDCVVTEYEEFIATFEQCLHCKAVAVILQELDSFYDIFPEISKDHDYTDKKSTGLQVNIVFQVVQLFR